MDKLLTMAYFINAYSIKPYKFYLTPDLAKVAQPYGWRILQDGARCSKLLAPFLQSMLIRNRVSPFQPTEPDEAHEKVDITLFQLLC